MSKKICPIDGSLLQPVKYELTMIDMCPTCHGVWCDRNELKEIVDARIIKFNLDDAENVANENKIIAKSSIPDAYRCGVCKELMERFNYDYASGIIIDRCRKGCGVWLDFGEIEKVQIYVEKWERNLAHKDAAQRAALRNIAQAAKHHMASVRR